MDLTEIAVDAKTAQEQQAAADKAAAQALAIENDRQQLIAKFKEVLGLDVAPAELVPNPQIIWSAAIEAWAVIVDGLSLGLVLAHEEGFYVQASPGYKKLVLRPRYIDPVDGRFVYMTGDGVHNLADLGTLLSRKRISMNSPPRLNQPITAIYKPRVGVHDIHGNPVP